ncbi:MAG: hypothetical protein VX430_03870 [Pseudomonadota bacterium]|nr:hypothetical protein [Pseudomonadota bacterium]
MVRTNQIPRPHMGHFHVADGVVLSKDATGLFNWGVWAAFERKGIMRAVGILLFDDLDSGRH